MKRKEQAFDLTLPPRVVGAPLYHWLRDTLRSEILRGGFVLTLQPD